MNIIVTAGGTRERIDAVRTIANEATGKLGSLIAQELAQRLAGKEYTIYYLCGIGSHLPAVKNADIRIVQIEGTDQLLNELSRLLTEQPISAVIHSMAVSDYKVSSITTPEQIAQELTEKLCSSQPQLSKTEWSQEVKRALSSHPLGADHKISSELEHPVLVLEKTPKIIGMIKNLSPGTVLVGFKLLSGVSRETLIETAYGLLKKNRCDFVLANDTDSFKDGNHKGYLVNEHADYIGFSGKEQIAKGIADSVLKKLLEE